jgi:hypothetical protein
VAAGVAAEAEAAATPSVEAAAAAAAAKTFVPGHYMTRLYRGNYPHKTTSKYHFF